MSITIRIPTRVWEDALNPLVSGMEADLGLPEPRRVKRGKGSQEVYENVPEPVARELAEYIGDRGAMLLGQGVGDPYDPFEKADRDTYRAAIKAAERILASLS